jgi:hypothetical protein
MLSKWARTHPVALETLQVIEGKGVARLSYPDHARLPGRAVSQAPRDLSPPARRPHP